MRFDRPSLALIASGFVRSTKAWVACLGCLVPPAYSQTPITEPAWGESAWFGGVVATVVLLHLQRLLQTGQKMHLLYVAVACGGAWAMQESALAPGASQADWPLSLYWAQMLFAGALVAWAWWMAQHEGAQAALALAAQQAQIASQRSALEKLQATEIALESKISQRTHELHLAIQQIEALSAQDGLTGVANRRRFDDGLKAEWGRATRSRQALSIAVIDIDWFTEFNTRYGHESGDACLCQLARVLETGVMRSGDLIARYSGGAFVLLAPDTDAHGILSIANYLCQEVLRLALPHRDSPYGCVSISIGVATVHAQDSPSPDDLLLLAQSCLASAQAQGRNRAVSS
jgi:diguanylate cyclase (GGDEF)-like protein